ncbi:MAG: hypothetical protein AAF850_07500 [Pseudomonadota bacterium]
METVEVDPEFDRWIDIIFTRPKTGPDSLDDMSSVSWSLSIDSAVSYFVRLCGDGANALGEFDDARRDRSLGRNLF